MLNTVEFYEERLEESYKKYFLYLERKECNYAECVLNAEISPNVYKLKRSVWAYHFSTPGRVLFLQNELF
jgi:hypothetical protein